MSVSGKRASEYPLYFQEHVSASLLPGERLLVETISDQSTLSDPPDRVVDTTLPSVVAPAWGWGDDFQHYQKRCKKAVDPQVDTFQAAVTNFYGKSQSAFQNSHMANFTFILDGIEDATDVLKHGEAPKHLIIFTDGIEDSEEYGEKLKFDAPQFWKSHSPAQIIQSLKEHGRLPDLTGVTVYLIGASASSPETYRKNAQFWAAYFAATGVPEKSLHYGHSPSWEEATPKHDLGVELCPPNL